MSEIVKLEEARAALSRIGKTAADIAREVGVPREVVSNVLSGRLKGNRGDAHKVAVVLGLKEGLIVEDGMSIAEALRKAAH